MFTIHRQRFRDDREILVSNDMPPAISRRLKMSVISGNDTYNATFCFLRLFQYESPISLAEIIFLEKRLISLIS